MLLNGWQLVLKTRVQVTPVKVRFLHLPFSTRSRKARRRADNAEIGGAVPPWWIDWSIVRYYLKVNLYEFTALQLLSGG